MKLVERHIIKRNHRLFADCDSISFLSKNLYNCANYIVRQEFINNSKYLNYNAINRIMIDVDNVDYRQLPSKVSNGILKLLDKNWKSFFASIKDYKKNPSKYLGRPKLPKYKHKLKGRYTVPYEKKAISKQELIKNNRIRLSKTNIYVETKVDYRSLQSARIIKRLGHYVVEIIYNKKVENHDLNYDNKIGIDLGVNNFASVGATTGDKFIINGRPLKSMNQYFNKVKAELQSKLKSDQFNSFRINKLTNKRNNKVNNYLHKASKYIIDYCLTNNIGTIVIGKNINWKQNINLKKPNNQNFVSIPFAIFIEMVQYKAELKSIEVIITEESYTSKCSFIDNESLEHHKKYLGRRITRGLFKSAKGIKINADINGAFNMIKKVFPLFNFNELKYGTEGGAEHPVIVDLSLT